MTAYYNEIDPKAGAWLRELIKQNLIAPGEVDERSILDVSPADLERFTQCHFFAGIGVWSYALRCAGWPDDRPVWTGSCPCQPFSAAGKGAGITDERHLWPAFFHLVRVRRPRAVFGEQVSANDGLAWLNHVRTDLEGEGYAVGVTDLCAAGFGAPHIRQRLYFVADADISEDRRLHGGWEDRGEAVEYAGSRLLADTGRSSGCTEQRNEPGEELGRGEAAPHGAGTRERGAACELADASDGDGWPGERGTEAGTRPDGERRRGPASSRADGIVADTDLGEDRRLHGGREDRGEATEYAGSRLLGNAGCQGHPKFAWQWDKPERSATASGVGDVGDAECEGCEGSLKQDVQGARRREERRVASSSGAVNGFWRDAAWTPCRDGKWRPVEPGTFPLAHGAPARVVRLRGYGNAIVSPVAEAFVRAYMEVRG